MPKLIRTVALVVLVFGCTRAQADDDAKGRSRELNKEATRALDAGDLTTALARYRDAYEAFPSPNLHFNLGLVLDKLGRAADAANELQTFLTSVPDAPRDARKFARDKLSALGPALGLLKVHCAVEGSSVRLDDHGWACDSETFVEPGSHVIEVSAEGHVSLRGVVDAPAGRGLLVEAPLDAQPMATPTVVEPASVLAAPSPRGPSRVAPIALGAVSGAVLLTGLGLYGAAQAHYTELFNGHGCDADCAGTGRRSNIHALAYAGFGLIAAGGVGLAVDLGLWMKYRKQRAARR